MKLKEAEARAEFAEKTVKKLQKEVDRLEGKLAIYSFSSIPVPFEQRVFVKTREMGLGQVFLS